MCSPYWPTAATTASIPDLIIAATAELAGLAVLHHDMGFDLIAEITGQPLERLALP
jgi:predicted nucleic acid-binding protein